MHIVAAHKTIMVRTHLAVILKDNWQVRKGLPMATVQSILNSCRVLRQRMIQLWSKQNELNLNCTLIPLSSCHRCSGRHPKLYESLMDWVSAVSN